MATALRHPQLTVRSLLGEIDDRGDPAPSAGDLPAYAIAALAAWLRTQPHPRGRVSLADRAVVYTSPVGRSVLAVLAADPADTHAQTARAVDDQLAAGATAVWVIDARRQTVTVHPADGEPYFANRTQTVPGTDDMPGFEPAVRELFE